ncbi:hypothetical protein [Streptomyces barkulensis]|uniref:hypothetical protein n=1 Tax=Streptomyces barkulensis TaxID=1257026 RepID=UPI000C6E2C91|nr:hypothetical protein [Streptomyces barkulensis]
MGKHTRRFRYGQRGGKTYVSCTACGVNLVPALTSFEEDPICRDCTPPISQRAHFAWLVAGLITVEAVVLGAALGWAGIPSVYRAVWDVITPW